MRTRNSIKTQPILMHGLRRLKTCLHDCITQCVCRELVVGTCREFVNIVRTVLYVNDDVHAVHEHRRINKYLPYRLHVVAGEGAELVVGDARADEPAVVAALHDADDVTLA